MRPHTEQRLELSIYLYQVDKHNKHTLQDKVNTSYYKNYTKKLARMNRFISKFEIEKISHIIPYVK